MSVHVNVRACMNVCIKQNVKGKHDATLLTLGLNQAQFVNI